MADVGLGTVSDRSIWEWAGAHGFVVVSKDADFHNSRSSKKLLRMFLPSRL